MIPHDLTIALNGRWNGRNGVARCPAHDDRSPSLSIGTSPTGGLLLYCFAGCEYMEVMDALRRQGLLPDGGADIGHYPFSHSQATNWRAEAARIEQNRSKAAKRIWDHTEGAIGSPVDLYLHERGINLLPPPTIRFLSNAKHNPSGQVLPAMVSCVSAWPTRKIEGIHRTFLTRDGKKKAPVSQAKMMLGKCRGGAVRLAPAAIEMIVTEGIETGLSVLQATGKTVWAALSAGGIERLVLPDLPLAKTVTIAADNDAAGIAASHVAAERWSRPGRNILITSPPKEGQDFNDILKRGVT